jgi:hypothetical protein
MSGLIEFLPFLVVLVAIVVARMVLQTLGLPLVPWWNKTPETVAGWRRLPRWQVVGVRGLLTTVPVLLWLASWNYVERLDPYSAPRHHYLVMTVALILFGGGGILAGISFSKEIWQAKYDLPKSDPSDDPKPHFSKP